MFCYKHNITYYLNDCPECLKEKYQKKPKTDEDESEVSVEAKVKVNFAEDLQNVINVLDTVIGDTDPEELDPDFTEDELIDEFPIIYCFQKLQEIKSKISA